MAIQFTYYSGDQSYADDHGEANFEIYCRRIEDFCKKGDLQILADDFSMIEKSIIYRRCRPHLSKTHLEQLEKHLRDEHDWRRRRGGRVVKSRRRK